MYIFFHPKNDHVPTILCLFPFSVPLFHLLLHKLAAESLIRTFLTLHTWMPYPFSNLFLLFVIKWGSSVKKGLSLLQPPPCVFVFSQSQLTGSHSPRKSTFFHPIYPWLLFVPRLAIDLPPASLLLLCPCLHLFIHPHFFFISSPLFCLWRGAFKCVDGASVSLWEWKKNCLCLFIQLNCFFSYVRLFELDPIGACPLQNYWGLFLKRFKKWHNHALWWKHLELPKVDLFLFSPCLSVSYRY